MLNFQLGYKEYELDEHFDEVKQEIRNTFWEKVKEQFAINFGYGEKYHSYTVEGCEFRKMVNEICVKYVQILGEEYFEFCLKEYRVFDLMRALSSLFVSTGGKIK